MAFYHLGYFSHFGNAAGESPAAPAFQLSSGIGRREGRAPFKKLLEEEFQPIGLSRLKPLFAQRDSLQLGFFFIGEVFLPFHKGPTGALEFGVFLAFPGTNLVEGFIDSFDYVKLVEGDGGFGKIFLDTLDECGGHVTADFLDLMGLPPVEFEMFHEFFERVRALAFYGEDEPSGVVVEDEGDVFMSLSPGGFVYGYGTNFREIQPLHGVINHLP